MAQQQDIDIPRSGTAAEDERERLLDKAIADSFPASDPVSLAMPHDRNPARAAPGFDALALPLLAAAGLVTLLAAVLLPRRGR